MKPNRQKKGVGVLGSMVRFELNGTEVLEKRVGSSGKVGRVYLPCDWVGHRVKIVRLN